MAACPACTFINADDATACECGASLGSAPTGAQELPADAAVKACAHCTLENAADASACVACGAWWCPRCTRCVPAAVACCDVCSYPDDAAAPVADAAPPAPITPDDVANKDYRPRRVERALAAMPLDALERIVDEPARFVALACGEQPPAARPVGLRRRPRARRAGGGAASPTTRPRTRTAPPRLMMTRISRRRRSPRRGRFMSGVRRDGHDARAPRGALRRTARLGRGRGAAAARRAAAEGEEAAPHADDLDDFIVDDDGDVEERFTSGSRCV